MDFLNRWFCEVTELPPSTSGTTSTSTVTVATTTIATTMTSTSTTTTTTITTTSTTTATETTTASTTTTTTIYYAADLGANAFRQAQDIPFLSLPWWIPKMNIMILLTFTSVAEIFEVLWEFIVGKIWWTWSDALGLSCFPKPPRRKACPMPKLLKSQ